MGPANFDGSAMLKSVAVMNMPAIMKRMEVTNPGAVTEQTAMMVMENMMELFESEGYEILSPLYHVKREGGAPTAEELAGRASAPHTREKSAPEALSMFDDIPKGK